MNEQERANALAALRTIRHIYEAHIEANLDGALPEDEDAAILDCSFEEISQALQNQAQPDDMELDSSALDEILHDIGVPQPKERKQVFRDFYKALVRKGYLNSAPEESLIQRLDREELEQAIKYMEHCKATEGFWCGHMWAITEAAKQMIGKYVQPPTYEEKGE